MYTRTTHVGDDVHTYLSVRLDVLGSCSLFATGRQISMIQRLVPVRRLDGPESASGGGWQ